jgi:hypothetical protein
MKETKGVKNPWALAWYMKGKGYKPNASEGKLPANIANIQKPDQYIQDLTEEEKKEEVKKETGDTAANPAIKTDNAGVTEKPEVTKVSQEMDKQTPTVDKLTQDTKGFDPLVEPDKVKEEKKKEPEVSTVEKAKAENEGKLPSDIANIQNPNDYIQNLAEDDQESVIADGITEESVAKDLAGRKNGEAVMNPETKLWKVISKAREAVSTTASTAATTASSTTTPAVEAVNICSKCSKGKCECVKANEAVPGVKAATPPETEPVKVKEEKVVECPTVKVEKGAAVPTVKAAKGSEADKLVKEDVDVTIKTDDKEVNIVSADGSTQITTLDVGTPAPLATVEQPPLTTETPNSEIFPDEEEEEEEVEVEEEEPELSDEEALEMAERLMVAEHLEKLDEKSMSPKQKKFIADIKAKKFSKKNTEKIEKKKKEIK